MAGLTPQAVGSQAVAALSSASVSATSVLVLEPVLATPQLDAARIIRAIQVFLMSFPSKWEPAAPVLKVNVMAKNNLHGQVRTSQ